MASVLKPKISRPEPLPPVEEPKKPDTTEQLAPKPAEDAVVPKKSTRRFRIDLGDAGYGSGLNIPT